MTTSTEGRAGRPTAPYNRTLVNDLSDHAWAQIDPVLRRVIGLADSPETAMQVAFLILGKIGGACGGITAASLDLSPTDENIKKSTLIALNIAVEIVTDGAESVSAKFASRQADAAIKLAGGDARPDAGEGSR